MNRTTNLRKLTLITLLILLMGFAFGGAQAQETTEAAELPSAFTLYGFTYIAQTWNNCGPATLTMGLTYFGVAADQSAAANWLKPNYEDKNVSPWQMAQYVNDYVNGVSALSRVGGDFELLKTLLVNEFPVIIESGYDPENHDGGWMGHYLLVVGYDDATQQITTYDSYDGQNFVYTYAHIEEFWAQFNRQFIVLYAADREDELLEVLGDDADERQNAINALELARLDALENGNDAFAWHNLGTNLVALGIYEDAGLAFDQARTIGLPWRMFWYQFAALDAYIELGRYDDVLAIVQSNLNDGGGQYVEESYFYGGLAREGMGETDRAINNYRAVLDFNPNFTPAQDALARLGA